MLPGFEGDFVVEAVPVLFVCRDVLPLPAVVLPEELFDWEELPPLELSGPETSAELSGALDSGTVGVAGAGCLGTARLLFTAAPGKQHTCQCKS